MICLGQAHLAGMIAARIPEITGDAPASFGGFARVASGDGRCGVRACRVDPGGRQRGRERGCPACGAGLWAYAKAAHGSGSGIQAQAAAPSVLPSKPRGGCGLGLRGQSEYGARRRAGRFLRDEAARELQRFRELRAGLDRGAWPAFLPLAVVEPYLTAMAAGSFDPLHSVATLNPLRQFSGESGGRRGGGQSSLAGRLHCETPHSARPEKCEAVFR